MRTQAPKAPPKEGRVDAMRVERERQLKEREAQAAEAAKRMKAEAKGQGETDKQRAERLHAVVRRHKAAFGECVAALVEMKQDSLFLKFAPTWELYCGKFVGITARHANRMLAAGETAQSLGSDGTNGPIPTQEGPLRELSKVEPAARAEVLQEAATEGKPTAAKIKQAADRRAQVGSADSGPRTRAPSGAPSPIAALLVSMRRLQAQLEGLAPENAGKHGTPHEATELDTRVAQIADWCRRYRAWKP